MPEKAVTTSAIGILVSGARRAGDVKAKPAKKLVLYPSPDISFDKLLLGHAIVWHITAGISVKKVTENIARRGLPQSPSVRPDLVKDSSGIVSSKSLLTVGTFRHCHSW